jgi:hypothetical protein
MKKESESALEKKLDEAIGLLKHLLALELAREGIPRSTIAKHIHVANAALGSMLKGVKNNGG